MRRRAGAGAAAPMIATLLITALMGATDLRAQTSPDATKGEYYKGKQITLTIGYGPGGGYDVYARLLARHMGRKIPGEPAMVAQNMPGAGSLRAANYIYNNAPRDGTAIATISRNMPMMGVLGDNKNVMFDARKFTWLGSPSSVREDANLLWVRKDAPVKRIEDAIRPGGPELILGSSAEGSTSNDVILVVREALGARIKMISGYPDSNALNPAIERGEIQGRFVGISAVGASRPYWFDKDSPVTPLLQFARTTRHPMFPDVPTAQEMAKDDAARVLVAASEIPYMLARPFVGPPGVPEPVAKILQTSFMAAANDAEFIEDAKKLRVEVSPVGPEEALRMLDLLASAPASVKEKLRAVLGEGR